MQFNIQFNDLYDVSNDSFDIENIEYVKSYLDNKKMDISEITKLLDITGDDLDNKNWYKYIKSDFFTDDIKNDNILLVLSKLYIYLIVNKEKFNNINIIKLLSKNLHTNNIKLLYNFINNLSYDIRNNIQKDNTKKEVKNNDTFFNDDNNNQNKYDSYFYEDEKKDNKEKRKDNVNVKNDEKIKKKKSSRKENQLNELTIKKYDNKNDSDSEITTINKRVNSPIHQFSGDEYNYESTNDAPVYSDDEDNNNILNDMIKKYKEKHVDDYYNYE